MLISYFATWVPIITSPSFMRTLLKGLERAGNYVSFQMSVSSKQNFADLTGLPHIRVNTEKHSFQQHLCNNHKNMTSQFVCLFAYAVCDSVSKTFSDWKWPYLHFWAPWAPPPLAQNCCLSGSHQNVWLGSTSQLWSWCFAVGQKREMTDWNILLSLLPWVF